MPHTPDSHACPSCGQEPCACATQVDENQPEWPTNTETNSDALQYSGGVNKPKTDVAGDGQTVMPTTAVRVQETEDLDENKCMECGMYESKCECDRPMDESLERIRELAGVQEAAKPDFLDIDQDGDREEPMTQAAAEKDQKLDEVLPAIGAALARTAVGSGASALTRGAASLAGQMAGKALQDKLSSNKENQAFESSLQDMTRLWKAYKA
jgi:rRNA maturation endonuclease Nob1